MGLSRFLCCKDEIGCGCRLGRALRDMKAGGGAADGKEREDVLSNKEKQLLEALSPRAAQEGVEIVTIEVVGSKKSPTIRV